MSDSKNLIIKYYLIVWYCFFVVFGIELSVMFFGLWVM